MLSLGQTGRQNRAADKEVESCLIKPASLFSNRSRLKNYFSLPKSCLGPGSIFGRPKKIECPPLVGYSIEDRVMDPRGELNFYENPVNSPGRSMLDGIGYGQKQFDRRT